MNNAPNFAVAISVVVPVYNMEKYLRECLDSVVSQTLREIEIICVNDGSTDSSPQILAEYAEKDPRVRVISQENRGVGEARNTGMRFAKGEFIAFLDPDDFLPDAETYATLYAEAKKHDVRACGGSMGNLNPDGTSCGREKFVGYIVDQAFPQNALRRFSEWQFDYGFYRYIFERKMLMENEIFFPPYIRYQDPIFCARALDAAGTLYALRRETYVYRKSKDGPDWTFPRRVFDLLRGLRDVLKFSRERKYAKLHYLQIFRLFEEFKPHVLALMQGLRVSSSESSSAEGEKSPEARELAALLREIEPEVDIALARQYKPDLPWFSVSADLLSPRVKVSVIVPVYNVEKYLRECLDSILAQTLREIEIICVNDGSTDSSLDILKEYATKDPRVRVISKPNSGYGNTMNTGLRAATGKYIGIVESDDFIVPEMYETLFARAEKKGLDIVKGNFTRFYGEPEKRVFEKAKLLRKNSDYGVVFNMGTTLRPFDFLLHTWAGIYRRDYLIANGVCWNETPGAAYQDNGFWFLSFCFAGRVFFVDRTFYMLRRDNPNSSVRRKDQVFAMNREYSYIREKIEHRAPGVWARVSAKWAAAKYRNYGFTFNRIGEEFEQEFVDVVSREFADARAEGILLETEFSPTTWQRINELIDAPGRFLKAARERKRAQDKSAAGKEKSPAKPLPRILVRIGAMFILNKSARKRWRERHMDLTPRDGLDVKDLSAQELALRRREKRKNAPLRRLFDAVVPATRAKISHVESHLQRANEERTAEILAELHRFREELRRSREEMNRSREELRRSREEMQENVLAPLEKLRKDLSQWGGVIKQIHSLQKNTNDRLAQWMLYRTVADAFPELCPHLRERVPQVDPAFFEEMENSPRFEQWKKLYSDAIAQVFSYKNRDYYARVPAQERARELKLWFKLRMGCDLDLEHPKTFNEKINWLKLNDSTPLKTRLADKFEVRSWIREKIGEKYLVPLLGVYDSFDEIDFSALPEKFVIKATHGSGFNLVVKNKAELDLADARQKFTDFLSRKFEFQGGFEMHYAGMRPRLIIEEFLDIDEASAYDWQAFCFNGKVKFYRAIVGGAHSADHGKRYYYDENWTRLPFTDSATKIPEGEIPQPENFDEFKACAQKLCAEFLHVRVDFLRTRSGEWKFGEMTFTCASGLLRVFPKKYDLAVGKLLRLPTDDDA